MIRNYFKTAFRNLQKNKVFSLINISGLTIGLTAFWLIALYVANELSFDTYHQNADRIYRVVEHGSWDGGKFDLTGTSAPFAAALKADYPEIKEAVRFDIEGGGTLTYQNKHLQADDIMFTDNSVFKIFTYHFLYGDAKTALAKPQSIVLTKTLAKNIFGDASLALNKTIYFENNYPNLVTGVIDDVPANSHFTFSGLRSFPQNFTEEWGQIHLYTYILLAKEASLQKLEAKLPAFYTKYLKAALGPMNYRMELQPLKSIHLHSNLTAEMSANGSMSLIYTFSIVAILILIIAAINYMNLSTARASIRIKEIGVRKVTGSSKAQLIILFLSESVLLTLIASVAAVILISILMPWFKQLTGKQLNLWEFGVLYTMLLLSVFSLITGIVSGIYPALFLSGFRIIPALKGQAGSQEGNILFRKVMVAFQFIITICMIAGSLIIYQQLHYVLKKDLGFNKDQVLTFHVENREVRNQIPALKAQLLQNPLIENVSAAGNPIGNNNIGQTGYTAEVNGKMDSRPRIAQAFMVDESFIPTLQIKLSSGRNFSENMQTDKDKAVIVNETLVKEVGLKDPVGKKIETGVDEKGNHLVYEIVGVAKDFHIYSLQHKIEPLILQLPPQPKDKDNLYVRISKSNVPAAIKYLEDTYRKFDPEHPVDYHFLDQNFAQRYKDEQKQGTILLIFTILAIAIACLGLFGLVTFMAEQRTKEIGIRKVLGASISSIVGLLSTDFLKLVFLAMLIASPIAYYGMEKWLQDFAYRINISWWIFALAGFIALIIALFTISFKSIKAALANPVKSLRSE
ncbi:ABC transporter permease [Mucilaginibacter arboris]|uniref:FtsX-like permease family protein n=1 Tax=Mucilaginibacter arboris TaxID=2682090 RepID=A0A7K1SZB2_9SPHI|nr:ABC transporter permease [Mucilaginibacter arboris]MVN22652.1 FtsX-like permease family protein [Mucilaginibacter arboris]